MVNSMDHHDICTDPQACVNKYFNDAMLLLDDAEMCKVINEKDPGTYLSKTVLKDNSLWCERVKKAIVFM